MGSAKMKTSVVLKDQKSTIHTCAKNGVIMAPTLAHEDDVPRPEARIEVGYT